MSEEPSLFESIRQKRKQKARGSSFYTLSVVIRAVLILGLGFWLMWTLYPRVIASVRQPAAAVEPPSPAGTVTFAEPDDIPRP